MRLWYFSSSINSFFKCPRGLDVLFLVGPFVYFHILCVRTETALVRLCECAGSPESSLFAHVISTIISRTDSNGFFIFKSMETIPGDLSYRLI